VYTDASEFVVEFDDHCRTEQR